MKSIFMLGAAIANTARQTIFVFESNRGLSPIAYPCVASMRSSWRLHWWEDQ